MTNNISMRLNLVTIVILTIFSIIVFANLSYQQSNFNQKPPNALLLSNLSNSITDNSKNVLINNRTIPENAQVPTIPEKGYLVQEVNDGIYWLTNGNYNTMFMVTDEGVVAVDAPPAIGQNYLKAISDVTNKPVKYVIYSHQHKDHIGAANIFPNNATYIAHQDVANELKRVNDSSRPIPNITFSDNYELKVGYQTLLLDYYGLNHSPGNIFIYAPKQKVLMFVDVIYPGWIPFKQLGLAKNVSGFIQAHNIALERYDFEKFLGGHFKLGDRQDVITAKEFVIDLRNATQTAIKNVSFAAIAQELGKFNNSFLITKTYTDTIANQCSDILEEKWKNKLGGLNEFLFDDCWAMSQSIRVD